MQYRLDDALAILERTPRTLNALLRDIPDAWAYATDGPDTWSPYDVVGHLIHGERTDWIGRARIILEQGEARAFDPFDRFAQFRESEGKTMEQLLDEFDTLRRGNVATLQGMELTEQDLDRPGTHPELRRVSLRQLLSTWVAHDLGHIGQVVRTMARQYADQVGPWAAYLRVVKQP
jgi:uncharacterized damage-inducible protein DinB